MPILGKQIYDPARLEKFANYIRQTYDNDTPQDYEIVIDGFRAVKRTANPEAFENYQHFVFPESKVLELVFYVGQSNNNSKYIFYFNEDYMDNLVSLQGLEVMNQDHDRYLKAKKKLEFEQLKAENQALLLELGELQTQVDTLEAEKLKEQQSQSPLKGILGEFGSAFLESFLRRNPSALTKIPGGEVLAGILEEGSKATITQPQPETEVSFKKATPASSELGEAEKAAIQFVEQLRERFTEEEFDMLLQILEKLAEDKSKISKVLNLFKTKGNEKVQL